MTNSENITRLQAYVEKIKGLIANPPERRKGSDAYHDFMKRELRKTLAKIEQLQTK